MEKKIFYENVVNFVKMFGSESTNSVGDPMWKVSIRTQQPVYVKGVAEDLMFCERKIAELAHQYLVREDNSSKITEYWLSPISDFNEGLFPSGIIGIQISLPGNDYDRIMGKDSMGNLKLLNGTVVTAYPRDATIAVFGTKCTPHPSK